ncbi:hypothetical protein [Thermaurantiacus sp.]
MRDEKGPGSRSALLVWLIGLALGIAAGALTAKILLPPRDTLTPPVDGSVRDRFLNP